MLNITNFTLLVLAADCVRLSFRHGREKFYSQFISTVKNGTKDLIQFRAADVEVV